MSDKKLSIVEFKQIIKHFDYSIEPNKLKVLIDWVSDYDPVELSDSTLESNLDMLDNKIIHSKTVLTNLAKELTLQCPEYRFKVLDNEELFPILDIYISFSGLQFTVENGELFLVEEMWYDRGCVSNSHFDHIGKPNTETIIELIKLYINKGKGKISTNPSLINLRKNISH